MDKLANNLDTENYRKRYEELDNVEKQIFDAICNIPYSEFKQVINNEIHYYLFETDYKGIKIEVLYCPHNISMYSTFDFAHKINDKLYRCATIGYIHGFIEYTKSLKTERNNKFKEEIFQKL